MTLWFVLGTAAELIKIYPLIKAAEQRGIAWRVVSTGQSASNFWSQYDDFSLDRSRASTALATAADLAHSSQAGRWFLRALFHSPQKWFQGKKDQDWIVVHGDTLSTLIGSIWAWRLGVRLAHVEAGLRSRFWWQPFPEEISRRFVSRFVDLHFAPDARAVENLRQAKVGGRILDTGGNSLYDAVLSLTNEEALPANYAKPLCVANLHRFENLNSSERWPILIQTLIKAAQKYQVVMVMHPQTQFKLDHSPDDKKRLLEAGVELKSRLPFRLFLQFMERASILISDGGSNQEESFYMGKPCLLLRQTTERQEGLGETAVLSRFEQPVIESFLNNPEVFRRGRLKLAKSPSQTMMDALIEVQGG